MKWFILVVGLVVICFIVALLLGLVRGGGMGAPTSSLRHEPLPETPLTGDDLAGLQFDVTIRGYRMSEVDGVVDRLRRELRERDEQIAVLRGDVQRSLTGTASSMAADRLPSPAPEPSPSAGPERSPSAGRPAAPDA